MCLGVLYREFLARHTVSNKQATWRGRMIHDSILVSVHEYMSYRMPQALVVLSHWCLQGSFSD